MTRGTDAREPANVVTALQVMISPDRQGQGLSRLCLERMVPSPRNTVSTISSRRCRRVGRRATHSCRSSATSAGRREDGLPIDPWLRVHARLGAAIVRPCAESMTITGTVSEWEAGGACRSPRAATYVVPGALELVWIDREADLGVYVEPNVWMHHRLWRYSPYEGSVTVPSSTTTRPSRSSERTASSSSVPRPRVGSRSEAENRRAPLAERALERPLLARGSSRVPRDGQLAASGHSSQRGTRARQIVAPRSMSACADADENAPARARTTRATFTSTGRTSSSSANRRIAAAVYVPTPGQLGQIVRPAARRDPRRRPVQVDRAPVVAEPLPLADRVARGRGGERVRRSASARATRGSAGRRARPASAGA